MSPIKYLKTLIRNILKQSFQSVLKTYLETSTSADEWLRTNKHYEQNNNEQYTRRISISSYQSEQFWVGGK